jgi:hypothetical protein
MMVAEPCVTAGAAAGLAALGARISQGYPIAATITIAPSTASVIVVARAENPRRAGI